MKDLSNHSAVPAKPSEADMNLQPRIVQADNQNDTRRHTADQRSQRRACHAPVESEYKQNISRHIDDIHDDGRLHGNPGISHGPKQRRTGIINRQKRIGKRRQYQIDQRVVHHVIRNPAVQKSQKPVPEQNRPHHDHNGDKPRDHHQLIRRLTRPLPVFLSQKL